MLLEGLLLACLGKTTTGSTSGNETYQAGGLSCCGGLGGGIEYVRWSWRGELSMATTFSE